MIHVKKMWRDLPEELLADILSRLPSKSVLRLSCVSKSWRSLVTDPSFIWLHYHRSQSFILFKFYNYTIYGIYNLKESLSLTEEEKGIWYSLRCNDPFFSDSGVSLCLPHSCFPVSFLHVIAVCHGLLCISYGDNDCSSLIICNPAVRRFITLPKLKSFRYPEFMVNIAFCFDSRNRDYKIIRVVSSLHHGQIRVQVYSLASGLWRTLPTGVAPACTLSRTSHRETHGFVNGFLHWGAKRHVENETQFFLLSFDYVDEVFAEIALPDSLARASSDSCVTVIGGGGGRDGKEALTVYYASDRDLPFSGSIWVMKEYGVVESWDKVFQFNLTYSSLEAPSFGITITGLELNLPLAFCVSNNGDIVLLPPSYREGEERVYLIDLEKKGFVDLQLGPKGCHWRKYYLGYYAETLVLLDNEGAMSY